MLGGSPANRKTDSSLQRPLATRFAYDYGLEPQSPGEEGLRDMRYITEIYRSVEINS
jgi:hypothetical protein